MRIQTTVSSLAGKGKSTEREQPAGALQTPHGVRPCVLCDLPVAVRQQQAAAGALTAALGPAMDSPRNFS